MLLTAVAIILGVAFIAGSYVFTDTLKDAFDVLFEQESTVDIVVRADVQFGLQGGRVPESLVDELEALPGVARVLPRCRGSPSRSTRRASPSAGGPANLAFSWTELDAELTQC